MQLKPWLQRLLESNRSKSNRFVRRQHPLRWRPWLDWLEDRIVPATVQFGLAAEALLKTAGTFTIPIAISAASSSPVSIPFTLGGNAVVGTDFDGLTASPVVIPAGQLAVNITGTLLTPNNLPKTLTFTLGAPDGGNTLGDITVNTMMISAPIPVFATTLSIATASVLASPTGATNMAFTVTRTGDLLSQITVGYTTIPGTAQPNVSFTPTTGTVTFASHSPTATILVPVLGDGLAHDPALSSSVQLTGIVNVVGPPVTLLTQDPFGAGAAPSATAVADINHDGKPDLIVSNLADNTVSVFLSTTAPRLGAFTFKTQQTFAATSPTSLAVSDINGDGNVDLVMASAAGQAIVLLNTTAPGSSTASFGNQQAFAAGAGAVSVALGDLNGDGRPDIVVANQYAATVSVLLNNTLPGAASASFGNQQIFATGNRPVFVAIGDLNSDGKPDVQVANYADNSVSVLLNSTPPGAPTASFAAPQSFTAGFQPRSVARGDFNGDGKIDLAVANAGPARWLFS